MTGADRTGTETATLAGGCFWCLEAVFQGLDGVKEVLSGYSGGEVPDPTYEQVCSGTTGHAEAVQITFDPGVVSFEGILGVYFAFHDPTTLNRQGPDVGTQYRSAIFFHSPGQKTTCEKVISELEKEKTWENPVLTEVTEFQNFYPAEDYHQHFWEKNPDHPYCQAVVAPKLARFRKMFSSNK